jgi:glutamate N-acetyltransferase/amino-acid N-acetyltransferase
VTALPSGFRAHVANIGIKDDTDDFVIVAADSPTTAFGVFTRSSFAGPSVIVSREHLSTPRAQAVVVISKNANVATGDEGLANAREVVAAVGERLGCASTDVLIASTGVIGRQYPMDRVRRGLAGIPTPLPCTDAQPVAAGIMTTDTVAKIAEASVGSVRIVGVAKGVGMIEPDMATMITLLLTDADIAPDDLEPIFRRVIDRTFNCVSIDTDTSTSDTAILMASGVAGATDLAAFERGLGDVAESLTKQIARDGEGAEKLIEVTVQQAASAEQAKRVAKAIVNSPLVKTAVHGADPELGTGGDGDRQVDDCRRGRSVAGGHTVRQPGGVPDSRRRRRTRGVGRLHARRRGSNRRQPGRRRFVGDRMGLRPHRWLRSDQRRLHDVTANPNEEHS